MQCIPTQDVSETLTTGFDYELSGFGIGLFSNRDLVILPLPKGKTQRNWHPQPLCHVPRRKVVKGESECAAVLHYSKTTS